MLLDLMIPLYILFIIFIEHCLMSHDSVESQVLMTDRATQDSAPRSPANRTRCSKMVYRKATTKMKSMELKWSTKWSKETKESNVKKEQRILTWFS